MTDAELELIDIAEMHQFIEQGVRGMDNFLVIFYLYSII